MERAVTYNSKRRGFTLAEVLIVVAIVAILAGVSVPFFSAALKNYKLKQVKDQETAAKAAAVAAFYSGYDSKGNVVDIRDTGVCTFIYDAENSAVYVLNYEAKAQDFITAGYDIEKYGYKVDNAIDHSDDYIIVTFDGRYCKYNDTEMKESIANTKNYILYDSVNSINMSKGTFEEPRLILFWD